MQELAVKPRRVTETGPAQHARPLGDRIEYGCDVGWRAADDLEDVARRRLPVERLLLPGKRLLAQHPLTRKELTQDLLSLP